MGSRRFGLLASINRRIAAWGNTFVADTPLSEGHEGGYNVTRLWSTGFPLPQVGSKVYLPRPSLLWPSLLRLYYNGDARSRSYLQCARFPLPQAARPSARATDLVQASPAPTPNSNPIPSPNPGPTRALRLPKPNP